MAAKETTAYEEGKKYLIRTVTHYYLGTVSKVYEGEIVMKDTSFITNTSQYDRYLETGSVRPKDPVLSQVIIQRTNIVGAVPA